MRNLCGWNCRSRGTRAPVGISEADGSVYCAQSCFEAGELHVGVARMGGGILAVEPVEFGDRWEGCCSVAQSCPTLPLRGLQHNPMHCNPPAPLSMEFSRQEYWSALPFPSPGSSMDEPILSAVQSVAQGAKTGILLGFYTQLILLCLGNYLVLITFIFSFYHLFAKSIFF